MVSPANKPANPLVAAIQQDISGRTESDLKALIKQHTYAPPGHQPGEVPRLVLLSIVAQNPKPEITRLVANQLRSFPEISQPTHSAHLGLVQLAQRLIAHKSDVLTRLFALEKVPPVFLSTTPKNRIEILKRAGFAVSDQVATGWNNQRTLDDIAVATNNLFSELLTKGITLTVEEQDAVRNFYEALRQHHNRYVVKNEFKKVGKLVKLAPEHLDDFISDFIELIESDDPGDLYLIEEVADSSDFIADAIAATRHEDDPELYEEHLDAFKHLLNRFVDGDYQYTRKKVARCLASIKHVLPEITDECDDLLDELENDPSEHVQKALGFGIERLEARINRESLRDQTAVEPPTLELSRSRNHDDR